MKKTTKPRRLELQTETIKPLDDERLRQIQGGKRDPEKTTICGTGTTAL